MNEQDYIEMNNQTWNNYFDNNMPPDELDQELEDNYEEYMKHGY